MYEEASSVSDSQWPLTLTISATPLDHIPYTNTRHNTQVLDGFNVYS